MQMTKQRPIFIITSSLVSSGRGIIETTAYQLSEYGHHLVYGDRTFAIGSSAFYTPQEAEFKARQLQANRIKQIEAQIEKLTAQLEMIKEMDF